MRVTGKTDPANFNWDEFMTRVTAGITMQIESNETDNINFYLTHRTGSAIELVGKLARKIDSVDANAPLRMFKISGAKLYKDLKLKDLVIKVTKTVGSETVTAERVIASNTEDTITVKLICQGFIDNTCTFSIEGKQVKGAEIQEFHRTAYSLRAH